MSSRMERYYNSDSVRKKRSQKNQDLYRTIYEEGQYTNIEGIASIEKNNEIDITKVQKMLKNREEYKRQKEYRTVVHREERPKKEEIDNEFLLDDNEKNYDIRDVLNKVKEEKPEEDDRYLRLNNDNYDLLKELKSKKENVKNQDEELKEMIDTITNTSLLNKMGDQELSYGLLDDLEDDDTDTDIVEPTEEQMDNSFFTASMKIKKEDFADEYEKVKDKRVKLKKEIFIIVFLIILIVIVGLVIFKILKS